MQRGDEHDAAQAYPLGAGGRVAHGLQRAHERHRAERLLQRPGALEAERLGPRHVPVESSRIELTVRNELRGGDRKLHHDLSPTCCHDATFSLSEMWARWARPRP